MTRYGWGFITSKENKRGRESVIFSVKPDILESEEMMKALLQHGVSRNELQQALQMDVNLPVTHVQPVSILLFTLLIYIYDMYILEYFYRMYTLYVHLLNVWSYFNFSNSQPIPNSRN